jgi:hypothetical protein
MTMRQLLNIVPFMRQSEEAVILMNRGLIAGTPRESKSDYAPWKTPRTAAQTGHGKVLYGLPCARCGAYYPADLAICPVCNSTERVFPKLNPLGRQPAFVPRSKAVDMPQEENLGNLATINRELLSNCA